MHHALEPAGGVCTIRPPYHNKYILPVLRTCGARMFNMGIPAALTDFYIDANFFKIGLPKLCKIFVFGNTGLDGKLKLNSACINTGFFKAFPCLIQVEFVLRTVLVIPPKAGRYKAV